MKKIILSAILLTGVLSISNSQTLNDSYSCVNSQYENLNICFVTNDVTGVFRGTGTTLYFQPDAGITYGQFSPCVDSYNKDRLNCPSAPLLVVGNMSKSKRTITQ